MNSAKAFGNDSPAGPRTGIVAMQVGATKADWWKRGGRCGSVVSQKLLGIMGVSAR